jgi:hypothetical protein
MIEAWVDGSCQLQRKKINAGEKYIVNSSVGEWHLNSMFSNTKDYNDWTEYFGKNSVGFTKYALVGKFRSKPCAWGNYSWMEYEEPFECVYSKEEPDVNGIVGLITYSLMNHGEPFILK